MIINHKFRNYAWGVFIYNIFVILWGAYVRATGSGAGCGAHWPSCNGQIFPRAQSVETTVEFIHRMSSGLTLVLVIILFAWGWRAYDRGHLIRKATLYALIFTITEALVGAGLVLFQLVANNASAVRAGSIAVHLVNTFLLLGSLTLCAWWAGKQNPNIRFEINIRSVFLIIGLISIAILGASGAITALGDTLFPTDTLLQGVQQDFSPTAHFLLRLRIIHPIIAVFTGVLVALIALFIDLKVEQTIARFLSKLLIGIVLVQLTLGVINVALLAPIWMQLLHLLFADILWVVFVLYCSEYLGYMTSGNSKIVNSTR